MRKIAAILVYAFLMCASMCAEGKASLITLASDALGDVGDLTSPESLWKSRAFVTIAANSIRFEEEALTVIGAGGTTEEQKLVIVYGMQTLPKMDYLRFFARIADLYAQGKCSDPVMALTLDPGFEWGCVVVQNYKSTFVSSGLQSIISSRHVTSAVKALVSEITSGKRFTRMLVYLESENDRGSDAARLPIEIWASVRESEHGF